MDHKKEPEEMQPEVTEIADSELDQVSGGFLRKVESKIPPMAGGGDGSDTQG